MIRPSLLLPFVVGALWAAGPTVHADPPAERVSFGGVAAVVGQCLDGDLAETCRGATTIQPALQYRLADRHRVGMTLGFAFGDAVTEVDGWVFGVRVVSTF